MTKPRTLNLSDAVDRFNEATDQIRALTKTVETLVANRRRDRAEISRLSKLVAQGRGAPRADAAVSVALTGRDRGAPADLAKAAALAGYSPSPQRLAKRLADAAAGRCGRQAPPIKSPADRLRDALAKAAEPREPLSKLTEPLRQGIDQLEKDVAGVPRGPLN